MTRDEILARLERLTATTGPELTGALGSLEATFARGRVARLN